MEYEPTETETDPPEVKCPKEATTKIIKKDQISHISVRRLHIDPNDVIVFDKSLYIDV